MSDAAATTVLVTGGSGYVGAWTVAGLLERGYRVRTTVRDLEREDEVRRAVAHRVQADDRLSFAVADLLRDDGWDAAVAGASFVLHIASPMPIREYRKMDLVKPAREGVRRMMRAARSAGVVRVVMMSSAAAASPPREHAGAIDESVWTDLGDPDTNLYARSKTLAERDAWELSRTDAGPPLTTILPSFVSGPVLQRSVSGSVELLQRLLTGALPAIPRIGFAFVDVRDLVDLQIRAMLSSAAAGERFIASGDFLWYTEVAAILRSEFGPRAAKVPMK